MNVLSSIALFCLLSTCFAELTIPLRRFEKRVKKDVIPLGGGISTMGEYYATLQLGTPAQTFNLQVDTGSSGLYVFAEGCSGCGSATAYSFSSSTSQLVNCNSPNCQSGHCFTFQGTSICGFNDTYGDGSGVSGLEVGDLLNVGAEKGVLVDFGAIMYSSQNFERAPVDGIWGVAYAGLLDWKGVTAMDLIIADSHLYNSFSMCLVQGDAVMTIGVNYQKNSSFEWTQILKPFLFYSVTVTNISVNSNSLGFTKRQYNNPMSIVDSGTTEFLLPTNVYNALVTQFQVLNLPQFSTLSQGGGASLTPAQVNEYPTVSIGLQGLSTPLVISGQQYLINFGGEYYFGIADSQGNGLIMGDVVMQAYHVVFDRAAHQVGFAPLSSCPMSPNSTRSWF